MDADAAPKRHKANRSALIRQKLQERLTRLQAKELEKRDRQGYKAQPQKPEEFLPWESIVARPKR